MRKILLPVVALSALALTACSSHSVASPQAHSRTASISVATSHPAPTSPPKPTAWTTAQAGAIYLKYVAPGNALLNKFNALPGGSSIADYTTLARQIAQADDVFARNLLAGEWPASARTQTQTLASMVFKERIYWSEISSVTTLADVSSITNNAAFGAAGADAAAAATTVRVALGLPSN